MGPQVLNTLAWGVHGVVYGPGDHLHAGKDGVHTYNIPSPAVDQVFRLWLLRLQPCTLSEYCLLLLIVSDGGEEARLDCQDCQDWCNGGL